MGPTVEFWAASLARSLWSGPLPTAVHTGASEMIPLWWGPLLQVDPGDTLTLLPTPLGHVVEWVKKPVLTSGMTLGVRADPSQAGLRVW